jgi:hypothetical protein
MTTPAFLTLEPGVRFRLHRHGATVGMSPPLVALASTLTFKRENTTERVNQQDTANPLNIPQAHSISIAQMFDIEISGKADFLAVKSSLEADFNLGTPIFYQINKDQAGAAGGGVYDVSVIVKSYVEQKSENNIVSFTATLEGQAMPAYTIAT